MDWSKYSTPAETLSRSAEPRDAGVVQTTAGQVRENEMSVRHEPELGNRAHSLIRGMSSTFVRRILVKICNWALPLPPEGGSALGDTKR